MGTSALSSGRYRPRMRAHLSNVRDFRSPPIDPSIQLDATEKANADRLGLDHEQVRRWKASAIAKAGKSKPAAAEASTTVGPKPALSYTREELASIYSTDRKRFDGIMAQRRAERAAKAD